MTSLSPPSLFETLRSEDGVLHHGERHLARLTRSAQAFGIDFDVRDIEHALAGLPHGRLRVRIDLSPDGGVTMTHQPFPVDVVPGRPKVAWAGTAIASHDIDRRHKIVDRVLYDAASKVAQREGLADLLFLNERGQVAEGAISNVFVEQEGVLLTPPVDAGALPGILREVLLEQGAARVADLTVEDVRAADALYLGSSLRGLREVVLLDRTVDVHERT